MGVNVKRRVRHFWEASIEIAATLKGLNAMAHQNQLTKGLKRRLMYVENKSGDIDGFTARIGWVTFSKTGQSIYYRGRTLAKSNGIASNFRDVVTGDDYWVSGIKKRGSNVHWAESVAVAMDDDAREEYKKMRCS